MFFVPESETYATQSSLEVLCAIDEKQAIVDIVFLG